MHLIVSLSLAALVAAASPALAAPPPGHPTPGQAREALQPDNPLTPEELTNEGKVLSKIDANEFSYLEVSRAGTVEWIAAPLVEVKPGSVIRYEEGVAMNDFYSKLLKRTFPRVTFVGPVKVVSTP